MRIKNKVKCILFWIVPVIVLLGCKKGDKNEENKLTILTTGKWYFKPTVEAGLQIPNSGFSICNLDDYIVFRADNTCDWVDGGTKCANGEGEIDFGNDIPWMFNNNESSIVFNSTEEFEIKMLDNNTLKLGDIILSHGN